MKIAIVRGDFANPWELQNFASLATRHEVVLFTGYKPISEVLPKIDLEHRKLFSPADLNFGKISKYRMALLNRFFVDAHILYGLENSLKGFDIAHCAETYFSFTQQCLNAKKKGYVRKVVSTVWENIPFNNEAILGRKSYKKRSISEVDMFLTVTKGAEYALVKEGADERKIKLLYPGVDLSVFRPITSNSYYGHKKNKNIKLLFVGRLVIEKGILDLLEVYCRLFKNNTKVELFVAGTGPLRSEIDEYIHKHCLKNIFLVGEVEYSHMPRLYSLCDILIHPVRGSKTWNEQFGMVLVEAMACGLPVLALSNGSVDEVVGIGGKVVNPEQFSETLVDLIKNSDERKKLSKLAIQLVHKRYDASDFSSRLEDIYRNLLYG
ncbi:MAG: glycosyltransferase family 4 protein [Candidatus Vogelbacteria bacterium]|nr:glycosyltransferase family 4 protein [Candidatus Vogelbacteria bacterium]